MLDFSRPGKPTDNSYIESFNGKLRAECLNTHWFLTLDVTRQKLEHWRRDCNRGAKRKSISALLAAAPLLLSERPHKLIGQRFGQIG